MSRLETTGFSVAFALILMFTPARGIAQCAANGPGGTCSLASSVSMTAGRVIQLQMSASSTTLTAPTPTDFDAGFNLTSGPTLTVRANAGWRLYLRSSTAVWSATNTSPGAPARTNKPAGDLGWGTGGAGPFVPLTTTDANLASGTASAGTAITLHYRTAYSWLLDTPGNYGLTLVLTLTSP